MVPSRVIQCISLRRGIVRAAVILPFFSTSSDNLTHVMFTHDKNGFYVGNGIIQDTIPQWFTKSIILFHQSDGGMIAILF